MTPPRALSLSDNQLCIVREAAKSVPIEWRQRYLQLISDRLFGTDVSDGAVATAVQTVLGSMLGGARCCGEVDITDLADDR